MRPSRPRQSILDLIADYTELVAPIRDEVIGHIDAADDVEPDDPRTADANGGDSPLGNLIADAQKVDADHRRHTATR